MDLMEELAFARKCMVKRRIMEAQVQGGVGGGGEVRRVHIIYFLSRRGHVEHPHLVRVHHLSRNGVRLRDVKRWLSELRGKDMPESFAWSYKRKYKAGYVWQDLLDEDLITPISDNEYVLKGSEIVSTSFNNEKCSNDEKEVSTEKKSQYSPQVETTKDQKSSSNGKCRKTSESPLDVSTKTSFEIEEESPRFGSETSSSTDDFSKHEKDKVSATAKQEEENGVRDKNKNNSGHAIPLASNLNDEGDNVNNNISTTRFKKISPPSSVSKSSIEKSSRSSFSGAASHMFRNWITCGAVDTNESAVMVINRSSGSSGVFSNKENNSKKNYKGEVGKREKLEGSERILAHSWLLEEHGGSARNNSFDERKGTRKSKAYESGEKKAVPAAYKPINGPNCSQCGRQFRPEKLHAHMKSCRGKKAMAKSSGGAAAASPRTTTEKTPLRTTENSFQKSSYYLADK